MLTTVLTASADAFFAGTTQYSMSSKIDALASSTEEGYSISTGRPPTKLTSLLK